MIINPTNSNTYTGKTDIVRGELLLGKSNALPTETIVDVDVSGGVSEPAIFDLASFNQTIAGLQDTATSNVNGKVTNSVALSTSVLTLNQSTDTTFDGVIENGAGTVELVKEGSGILTLNGVNTYSGATLLNSGQLNVGGTLVSALTVGNGARLGGEGLLFSNLMFSSGASSLVFDPSTQLGALTVPSISATGATVMVVSSGTLIPDTTYTVLKNTAGFTGDVSDVFVSGARGVLAYGGENNTELQFTASEPLPAPLVWQGSDLTNPTYWDVNTTENWMNGEVSDKFFSFDAVTFGDTYGSGSIVVRPNQIGVGAMLFNNNTVNYTISGGSNTECHQHQWNQHWAASPQCRPLHDRRQW